MGSDPLEAKLANTANQAHAVFFLIKLVKKEGLTLCGKVTLPELGYMTQQLRIPCSISAEPLLQACLTEAKRQTLTPAPRPTEKFPRQQHSFIKQQTESKQRRQQHSTGTAQRTQAEETKMS